ncbi:MAG: methyltransferase family protein [Stackebrandtia sp.]
MITVVALSAYVTSMLAITGLRSLIQYRRTGDFGWRVRGGGGLLRSGPQTAVIVGLFVQFFGMLADFAGLLPLVEALDVTASRVVGVAIMLAATAGVLAAQLAMGSSWRIGVADDERTRLVVHGWFAFVRNPIFAGTCALTVGAALAVPNLVVVAGVALTAAGVEYQVRRIEEPHLRRIHGDDYLRYAATVGRFVPHVGRLRQR